MTDTATQILETSRSLFNEQGVENVAISQITKQLGISAGNLTYHFAKKQHIVGEHIRQLEKALVATVEEFSYDGNAAEFFVAYVEFMQITWEYRYLFNGTAYLLQNTLLTKLEYTALVERINDIIVTLIDEMIEFGSMQAIPNPFSTRTLVDCVWQHWLGWLDANQILAQDDQMSEKELLKSGIEHQIFMISPYLSTSFREKLHQEFIRYKTI